MSTNTKPNTKHHDAVALIMDSYNKGNGCLIDTKLNKKVSDSISIDETGLVVRYQGLNMKFQNQAHKDAFLLALIYRSLEKNSYDLNVRFCDHISKGPYLALRHGEPGQMQVSIWERVKDELSQFGFTDLVRVSPRSKLYILKKENIRKEDGTFITGLGYVYHGLSTNEDTFAIDGIKVELPEVLNKAISEE